MTNRYRAKRRGAAMVEAALVMPVILMFYGLFVYMRDIYEVKSQVLATTRHQSVRTALHQCQGGAAPGLAGAGFNGVTAFTDSQNAPYAKEVMNGARIQSYVETHGMKSKALTQKAATNAPLKSVDPSSHTFNSESQVYCVPRTIGGSGPSYVEPARKQALAVVDRAIKPVIDELREIFNEKL